MESRCHLSRLPTELLCMILDNIPDDDKIAFKFAYPLFFSKHRSINIREVFTLCGERIDRLLVDHPNPDILTHLDLNFCYWIPSDILINFVKRCSNLKSLTVAHTNITCANLANILHHSSISKLGFSVNAKGFWLNEKQVVKYLNYFCRGSNYKIANASASWQSLLSFSHFGKCKHFLTKLTHLDLYIAQDAILLGSFLSACDNLEHLYLRISEENDHPNYASEYMKILSNIITQRAIMDALESNLLKPCKHFQLKSFVLVNYDQRTTSLETHMQRLVERVVGPIGHRLQCLWTALPFTVPKNELFDATNLVAWKEPNRQPDALPFNMSQMESLISNKYMHRGDFASPELKLVECGFWKEQFKAFCREHPYLERIRLNKRPCENSELFSVIDWYSLARLTTLSIHPRIIYSSDYLQNSWMRNRAERALCNLLESYPTLMELEISPDYSETPESIIRNLRDSFINADSLSRLGLCYNLKKFTIRLTTISYKKEELNEPPFLEEIIAKCPNLESLDILDIDISITYHGVRERNVLFYDATYNNCIDRCIKAAQTRDNLRFFRLKFRTSSSYEVVIRRLSGYFPALVQFALILTNEHNRPVYESCTVEEFVLMCKNLVENKPKLMAVLVVLPGVPSSLCTAATRALEAAYRPTRPCFSALVTNSVEGATESSNLPWIHCHSLGGEPRPIAEFPLRFTGLHSVQY